MAPTDRGTTKFQFHEDYLGRVFRRPLNELRTVRFQQNAILYIDVRVLLL